MPLKDQVGSKPRKANRKVTSFKTVRVKAVDRVSQITISGITGIETVSAKQVAFEAAIRLAAELTGKPSGPVVRYHTDRRHPGVYRCKVAIG